MRLGLCGSRLSSMWKHSSERFARIVMIASRSCCRFIRRDTNLLFTEGLSTGREGPVQESSLSDVMMVTRGQFKRQHAVGDYLPLFVSSTISVTISTEDIHTFIWYLTCYTITRLQFPGGIINHLTCSTVYVHL